MIRLQTLGTLALRAENGSEITGVPAKRLGLLIYLVLATPRGLHRRDRLIALFWPESDAAKGRAALSRAIYDLRNTIGPDVMVTRGDQEVGVDFTKLQCDAVLLEQLFQAREYRQALDLCHGDLLPGFFVTEAAPEFDQWLDERRAGLRALAGDAAWRLAEQAEANNRYEEAVRYAQRSLSFQPGNETALRRVMQLLDRVGDRAAAAGVYREFAAQLEQTFELEPAPETQQLLAQIRARSADPLEIPPLPELATSLPSEPIRRTRAPYWLSAAALALIALAVMTVRLVDSRAATTHVLAVGQIDVAADSLAGFATLLTTNLARIAEIDVLSEARLLELSAGEPADVTRAAQLAGASDLLEGTLSVTDGGVRLDLRRVDVRSRRIDAAFSVNARDVYQLADIAVERIARELKVDAPVDRLDGRTTSLMAYRFYEEGLRAYYAADEKTAQHFLRAALEEDSTFAMAAWYMGKLTDFFRYRAQAARFAHLAHDRERLVISAEYALVNGDPRALAIAESLALRFPHEPDANITYAKALTAAGQAARAIPFAERVLASDTPVINSAPRCRACDAFGLLNTIYSSLDSVAAFERTALRHRRLQPTNYHAWFAYWSALSRKGDYAGAEAAMDSAARFAPDKFGHTGMYSDVWMRRGEFARIDRFWNEMLRAPDAERQEEALWFLSKSYREQGRLRDAMVVSRRFRDQLLARTKPRVEPLNDPRRGERLLEAIVLLEMGRAAEAGAIFESIGNQDRRSPINSGQARHRLWHFTHAATAYAQARDTAKLRAMYDSVRSNAERVGAAHLRALPHYVRGLQLTALGKHQEALAAFLKGPDMRRVQFERARSYLALGRPRDAIPELQHAFTGPHHHYGLYLTQGDIQEMLGLAYQRANQPDSARAQYRRVLEAWKAADPVFDARRASLEARLDALDTSNKRMPGRP